MASVCAIASAKQTPVLQAHDITLRFGGVTALANVSIDARDHADLPEFYLGLEREGGRKRWLG